MEILGLAIASLWLLLCCAAIAMATRVTDDNAPYNKNIKEATWRNVIPKLSNNSRQSKPHEALNGKSTSAGEATWSLGAEVLERSLSIERSNRIREPAAESGSNKE